jgi:hypothetical protein
MKLYELPRESYFTLTNDETKEVFFFKHIDGMYSYCLDMQNEVIHFAAWTEVNQVIPVKTYAGNQPNYVQVNV